jgi:hypothetical protein
MIILPNFYGSSSLTAPSPVPDFMTSFDRVVGAGYKPLVDFKFGTGVAPQGSTKIDSAAALGEHFNAFSENANQIVINSEVQRYVPFSSGENFVFADDALELTATLHNMPSILQPKVANVVGAVNESRTVTLNDASQINVGQMLSIGPENLHCTQMMGIYFAGVVGKTLTLNISSADPTQSDGFTTITFVYNQVGAEGSNVPAQWFVDQINSHPTLQQNRITAARHQTGAGAFYISWPRRNVAGAPVLGKLANGSLQQYSVSASYNGTMQLQRFTDFMPCVVIGKTGNTLQLSHPVTFADGAELKFPPFYSLQRSTEYAGGAAATVFTFADASMATFGQVISVGFGDSNYHRLTACDATTITSDAAFWLANGRDIRLLPWWQGSNSAAVSNTKVIPFSALPYGAVVGMLVILPSGNQNTPLYVTAVDTTAKTVTVSYNVTITSGQRIWFGPPIQSGQIWSKFIAEPGELGRDWMAIEWEVDCPKSTDWGAWPALWQFTDTNDPNPGTGSGGDEIDIMEIFTYYGYVIGPSNPKFGWNNNGYTSTPYTYPGVFSGGILPGNSMDQKTSRRFGMIWSTTKVFFYIDGVLVGSINKVWNAWKRPQFVANLAMGTNSAGNSGTGLMPVDMASFPVKFRIKRFRILSWPDATPLVNAH